MPPHCSQLVSLQTTLGEATRAHGELADSLQERYMQSERSMTKLKAEIQDLEDVIDDQARRT